MTSSCRCEWSESPQLQPRVSLTNTLDSIEIFFHHVHPFAPFLRREQLQPRLTAGETIYQWPIQLYAVVACSLRVSLYRRRCS